MKLLFLVFALLLVVSRAGFMLRYASTEEVRGIATKNNLYSHMRGFGLEEIVKKALGSHGVQLTANPEHLVHSVRTALGGSLEVTFEGNIQDAHGKAHRISFLMSRQGRYDLTKLESYTLSQRECLKNETLKDCLKREAKENSKAQNKAKIQS